MFNISETFSFLNAIINKVSDSPQDEKSINVSIKEISVNPKTTEIKLKDLNWSYKSKSKV